MARDNNIRYAVRQPSGLILPCSCAYTVSEAIERTVSYPQYKGDAAHVKREWRRMKRNGWTCLRVHILPVSNAKAVRTAKPLVRASGCSDET